MCALLSERPLQAVLEVGGVFESHAQADQAVDAALPPSASRTNNGADPPYADPRFTQDTTWTTVLDRLKRR